MHFYASGNKAGKLLAHQIKGFQTKTSISFIYHPITNSKKNNPQEIADAFSLYYSTLYNLKDEASSIQPESSHIQSFLDSVHLPRLTPAQLKDLNAPFTSEEVGRAIESLPNNKALVLLESITKNVNTFWLTTLPCSLMPLLPRPPLLKKC